MFIQLDYSPIEDYNVNDAKYRGIFIDPDKEGKLSFIGITDGGHFNKGITKYLKLNFRSNIPFNNGDVVEIEIKRICSSRDNSWDKYHWNENKFLEMENNYYDKIGGEWIYPRKKSKDKTISAHVSACTINSISNKLEIISIIDSVSEEYNSLNFTSLLFLKGIKRDIKIDHILK
jgi:hypothetical protein